MKAINLAEKLSTFSEYWHAYDDTGDFFLLLNGTIWIQLRREGVAMGTTVPLCPEPGRPQMSLRERGGGPPQAGSGPACGDTPVSLT